MFPFSEEQIRRYSRHIILPEVGGKGQKKLLSSRVLLVGAGGLGCPSALYLAAAGVGHLGLVDFDIVEMSNLQRQILHSTKDIGRPKVESAKESLEALNPDCEVRIYKDRLNSENIIEIFSDYDLVVDGSDNFPTRFLINDACFLAKKVNIFGAIFRFEGQATVFDPGKGPCYRCLLPEPPPPGTVPSCQEAGVIGVLPGFIGTIQAMEAIKLLLGIGKPLIGRLLLFDSLDMEMREVKVRKNPKCPVCGENAQFTELIDYDEFCGLSGA